MSLLPGHAVYPRPLPIKTEATILYYYTVCPGSSDTFYIASLLYKLVHHYLDILYIVHFDAPARLIFPRHIKIRPTTLSFPKVFNIQNTKNFSFYICNYITNVSDPSRKLTYRQLS